MMTLYKIRIRAEDKEAAVSLIKGLTGCTPTSIYERNPGDFVGEVKTKAQARRLLIERALDRSNRVTMWLIK